MGASQSQIDERLGHLTPDDTCEVLQENWQTVAWFLEIDRDGFWKYVGDALLGLDVLAIKADCSMSGKKIIKQHYKGVKLMGQIVANQLNRKRLQS